MIRAVLVTAALVLPASAWGQQVLETAGSRALGMGGAFVAVADDASAVRWNPAGLVTGPAGAMTIEWVDFRSGNQSAPPAPGAADRSAKFVSVSSWPVGLSYGRFTESTIAPTAMGTRVDSLRLTQFGASVLQTLVPGLVVGTTLKYVRGTVVSAATGESTTRQAFRAVSDLDGPTSGRFDMDLGVMADFRRARVGLHVRNMLEPNFEGVGAMAIELPKQSRLGLALLPSTGVTLAMDLDLDTVDLRDGPRRMVAFGGENRIGRRLALRGGVRWNLEGARRPVGSAGVSISVGRGLWLDGHYTHGRTDADRGFGAALRAGL